MEELTKHITAKLVKVSLKNYKEERRKIDTDLRIFKLDQQNMNFPTIIYLNVGGHVYTTTQITLLKRFPNSYFKKMLNREIRVRYDRDGNIFIDRNGTLFRQVLNYLRDGRFSVIKSALFVSRIKKELDFFELPPPEMKMIWSWDIRSSNYPQSLTLSNSGKTINKKDYTSNVYIFGNVGLSGEGIEWHIKIDKMQAYNELIMGIVEKDKKPGLGTAAFQWSG